GDAVLLADPQPLVREQRETQVVAAREPLMAVQALRADGPDAGAEAGESLQAGRIGAQLPGADRGVVARVESQHHRAAALRRQRVVGPDRCAGPQFQSRKSEVRGRLTGFWCLSQRVSLPRSMVTPGKDNPGSRAIIAGMTE